MTDLDEMEREAYGEGESRKRAAFHQHKGIQSGTYEKPYRPVMLQPWPQKFDGSPDKNRLDFTPDNLIEL